MDVTLINNSTKVLEALARAKSNTLTAIGITGENHAKEYETAVVTGRLRNSITHATQLNSVYIGTNVKYAEGIETGSHRKAGGLHFLQKAVQNHTSEYKELAKQSFDAIDI